MDDKAVKIARECKHQPSGVEITTTHGGKVCKLCGVVYDRDYPLAHPLCRSDWEK